MSENLAVGVRVDYLEIDGDDQERWVPMGAVSGFGSSNGIPLVLVELDEGRWVSGRSGALGSFFLTVMTVHADNLRVSAEPVPLWGAGTVKYEECVSGG